MIYKQTTLVPNILFDRYLPLLTESELKILLIIIRQTYGWVDKKTSKRKISDRISHGQFIKKTGLSRRVISKTLKSLLTKGLITISDHKGQSMHHSQDRKGQLWLFYAFNNVQPKPKLGLFRDDTFKCVGEIIENSNYNSLIASR